MEDQGEVEVTANLYGSWRDLLSTLGPGAGDSCDFELWASELNDELRLEFLLCLTPAAVARFFVR